MIVNWLNKHLTHNRDVAGDFGIRVVIHIPIGFLMGITPVIGWGLIYMFCKYQRNEDAHTQDQAWKDYYGAIAGFILGAITLLSALLYLVLRQ